MKLVCIYEEGDVRFKDEESYALVIRAKRKIGGIGIEVLKPEDKAGDTSVQAVASYIYKTAVK